MTRLGRFSARPQLSWLERRTHNSLEGLSYHHA
jgi:hypothetical protein